MIVFVNGKEMHLLPGMSVEHALIQAGLLTSLNGKKIYDEWGNEVGMDGATHEGMKIFVR